MQSIISKKTAEFLKRMESSKNDLERVQLLNDMEQLLVDERERWAQILAENIDLPEDEHENIINEASIHIAGFEDTIKQLNAARLEFLPGALRLQDHQLRDGSLKFPIIKLD